MTKTTALLSLFLSLSIGIAFADSPAAADAELFRRSVVSTGDSSRVQHVLAKAREGGDITVAVIGGSITAGARASTPAKNYGSLIAQWWRATFPKAKVTFVNAGIGATGSNYGALRAQRDLLSKKPDFVVAEYAVNDGNTQAAAETLEGLIRQILSQPNHPAVMLLFTMNDKGANAQEWHGKVGAHYSLPMVSFRDALWPEIQAGRNKWEDVEADQVHPNDRGHAYCASFVTAVLDKVLSQFPPKETLPEIKPIPKPLLSDLFQHCTLMEADALKPASASGWAYDPKLKAWTSDKPGSAIDFQVEGRVIFTMHYVIKGPMGKARVIVDGQPARELNGWFDQTWGGYRQTNEILRLPESGKHRVRFELLEEKSDGSTGTSFRIMGLGVAGTAKP